MFRFFLPVALVLLSLLSACQPEDSAFEPVTLRRGGISLSVDPALGGRITSFQLDGKEILKTSKDSLNLQWGSTTWTSPQSDWNWPPIATFDSGPYAVSELREGVVLLESERDPDTFLRMRKRISVGGRSDVGITYWVTNEGVSSIRVAVWENTRLPYDGYFTFSADSVRTSLSNSPVEMRDSTAFIYLDDRHAKPQKVFASLRSSPVTYHYNDLVFKKYTDVTQLYRTAPEQAPLEIYLDPPAGFAEFELQGDYLLLEPGESANLRVRWELTATE